MKGPSAHAVRDREDMPNAKNKAKRAARIRALNDAFRISGVGGRIMSTIGIRNLESDDFDALWVAVRAYNEFTEDNDPYGEHDFGVIEVGSLKLFWKIEYLDLECCNASPDPADDAVTTRVMTLMRADEY